MFAPWVPGVDSPDIGIYVSLTVIAIVMFFTLISIVMKTPILDASSFLVKAKINRIDQRDEALTINTDAFRNYIKITPPKVMYNHVHVGEVINFVSLQDKTLSLHIVFLKTPEGRIAKEKYLAGEFELIVIPVIAIAPIEHGQYLTRIMRLKHVIFKEK